MYDLRQYHQKSTVYERMHTNPLIRKIMLVDEVSMDHATYSSIGSKCAFFMAMVILGVALFLGLQTINPATVDMGDGTLVVISNAALLVGALQLVFFVVTPFVAMLIKKTIPVTGTLYCISVGYCISLVAQIIPEYQGMVQLALIITAMIVAVMGVVYGKGWIKVDQKFRSVIKTLFFVSIGSSALVLICYFVPPLRPVTQLFIDNPVISLGASILYVVIAAFALLVDFNAIQQAVERKMPRKYEWIAAFGLAFSVIWLFLKVLDVLMKVNSKNASSSTSR